MPEFERENDRLNQKEIADFILRRWPLRYDGYIFLSAMLYRLDGVLWKKEENGLQKPKLFFETKQRTVPFRHFENYTISSSKLIAARDLRNIAPAALFVRFSDQVIAAVDLAKHDGTFVVGGRPPRPGSPDIEPMAVFQWEQFKVIHDPRPDGGV
jgi:hypothetical protein